MTTNHKPATPLPWDSVSMQNNDIYFAIHASNSYTRSIECTKHIRDLAKENMKGQDGYEQIAEWADSLLRELGEE